MAGLRVKNFKPKVPRASERLLQGNYATEALNCKLTSGRLDPLRGLTTVHTSLLEQAIATMYRYRFRNEDLWFVWPEQTDVVRSPTAQETLGRVYFTSQTKEPRMTAHAEGTAGLGPFPAAWFVLGVYIPAALNVTAVVGGVGANEERSYVNTLKTRFGEESAPSLPDVHTGKVDGSWDLSLEALPPNSGTVTDATVPFSGMVEVTLDTVRGLAVHEEIIFDAVGGMTDLNGSHRIAAIDAGTNKIQVALTTAQSYTAGGTWERGAPHNLTGMKRCIYRTVGTNTDYKLVAEIDASLTTYSDTVLATALGGNILTLNSFTPPKNGHSLVELANGCHAMLAGNEVCFSEPYKPHSWPIAYRYAFSGTGVAQVAAGNSVVVLTDVYPIVFTATVPEAASPSKLEEAGPCVSKDGVIDTGGGAVYPSNDGLWLAAPGVGRKLTGGLYRQDEWKLTNPHTFKAAYWDGCYYAVHLHNENEQRILRMDLAEPEGISEADIGCDSIYHNPRDGRLYLSQGNKIREWDSDDTNRLTTFWKSAEYQFGPPINFSWGQVHARYEEIIPPDPTIEAANLALLASADNILGAWGATEFGVVPLGATQLQEVPQTTARRVQFTLLRNRVPIFTKDVHDSRPFRLPGGFKDEIYAIELATSLPVYGVGIAQGTEELKVTSQ